MLVTAVRYAAITGDISSAASAVSGWIGDATEQLEDHLDRKLESAARTERMYPTRDGSLWPHAIPVTVAAGYTIDGHRLSGTWLNPVVDLINPTRLGIDVTYTGGWVERTANPTATNRLPTCIETDLAIAAFLIGHPVPLATQLAAQQPGATSVRLGDAAVTYGPNGAPAPRPTRIVWSAPTCAYRYLRIGGDPC